MTSLEALFAKLARRTAARWWIGARPDVRDGKVARTIAYRLGYPDGPVDPFLNDGMTRLERRAAAFVIARAGTRGLAHPSKAPSAGSVNEAFGALAELSDDAVFLSNGNWHEGGSTGWSPISTATFDGGVIGYDRSRAFIFWVEEED
jgi:hypothetical protein